MGPAQTAGKPIAKKLEIVDCRQLKDLSPPIKRNLGPGVRCRLETAGLLCLPGLVLTRDANGEEDLCATADGRLVGTPFCRARAEKLYNQATIQRGHFLVERAGKPAATELLDIPFNLTGRKELLAQSKPIRRPGPDACVYLRQEVKIYHRPRPKKNPQSKGGASKKP